MTKVAECGMIVLQISRYEEYLSAIGYNVLGWGVFRLA